MLFSDMNAAFMSYPRIAPGVGAASGSGGWGL